MYKVGICVLLVLVIMIGLTGCGNMSMGIGNYSFQHVHFDLNSETQGCATVAKWYDNERGIEVKTEEYGPLFLSEGTYILVGSVEKCPWCN